MNLRTLFRRLILPLCLLVFITTPVQAENPLKSITNGLKKVGSALNPFKKSKPPKALPPAKPPQPAAKPKLSPKKSPAPPKKQASRSYSKSRTSKNTAQPQKDRTQEAVTEDPKNPETNPGPAGNTPPDKTPPPDPSSNPTPAGTDVARPNPEAQANPETSTAASPAKPNVPKEIPFGIPVLGRPGFNLSPFAKDAGEVDVVGIAAGAKVKCPYTGKIFRVP